MFTIRQKGKDILLVRYLEPVLMVGRESNLESNIFNLLGVDEEEEIAGEIEDLIFEEEDKHAAVVDNNNVKQT